MQGFMAAVLCQELFGRFPLYRGSRSSGIIFLLRPPLAAWGGNISEQLSCLRRLNQCQRSACTRDAPTLEASVTLPVALQSPTNGSAVRVVVL